MNPTSLIHNHHSLTERLANLIEDTGPKVWQASDFAGVDQLHLGGLEASKTLAQWLPLNTKRGLDIGCGLGGTSRYLVANHGCSMIGLDLNDDYIQAAQLLNNHLSGLSDCHFVVGNSLALPFAENTFDFVVSQHASMNIPQKNTLIAAMHKVLKAEGCLLLHEVMLAQDCSETSVEYPTPWADQLDQSHLSNWPSFMQLAHAIGFDLIKFKDNTMDALEWMHGTRNQPPKPPFTPQLTLGPKAGTMSANMLRNLQQGRLQIVSALLFKASS